MKKVFYFGLEPLKARYTYQLSKEWMPATFAPYVDAGKLEFIDIEGEFDPDQQIKVGAVLDELTDAQATYLGIPKVGPFKADAYRY